MHVHINHMFCTEPCWEGEHAYWCRYMVAVEEDSQLTNWKDAGCKVDWENLTEEHQYFDEEEYQRYLTVHGDKAYSSNITDEQIRRYATRAYRKLKPEVIQWLEENVADRRDKEYPKGWCIGNDAYHYRQRYGSSISIFFERRKDALAFIKKWSGYGKPTTYFDYFREIRKELNQKTNRLVKVDSFS